MVLIYKDEILLGNDSSEKYRGLPWGTVYFAVGAGPVCDYLNES